MCVLPACQAWRPPAQRPLAPPIQEAHYFEHRLRVEAAGETQFLHAVLITSSDVVTLVALTETGMPVLQLRQTKEGLEEWRSSLLPDALPSRLILADVQFIFWSDDDLRRIFAGPWSVRWEEGSRLLYNGEELEVRVDYQNKDGWHGRSRLENFRHGYHLTIMPITKPEDTP